MKIIPLNNKIQLQIEKATAGSLNLDSKATATEVGTIVAKSDKVDFNIGDKLMYKAWALDVITHEGETYYFIDSTSEGICAVIKE